MSWIINKLRNIALSKYLGGIIRHGLSTVAGFMVGISALSTDAVEGFVNLNSEALLGLLLWAIAQGLSILEKRYR